MKTRLSPFVYKVKGQKNYILFDSLRGQIFNISPEGSNCRFEIAGAVVGFFFHFTSYFAPRISEIR